MTASGKLCFNAGVMDEIGILGGILPYAETVQFDTDTVVEVGLVRIYGKSGFRRVCRLSDGRVVFVLSEKWIQSLTDGIAKPSIGSRKLAAVVWKTL